CSPISILFPYTTLFRSQIFRAANVLAEGFRREVVDQPMAVAVRGDLVPLLSDRAHQPRKPLGDPSEDEERGLHPRVVEDAEQARSEEHTSELQSHLNLV